MLTLLFTKGQAFELGVVVAILLLAYGVYRLGLSVRK